MEALDKIQKFREYLDYIEEHIKNVRAAWDLINEKCDLWWMDHDYIWHSVNDSVAIHDLSKLSAQEFTQYRLKFFPTDNEKSNESYEKESYAVFG